MVSNSVAIFDENGFGRKNVRYFRKLMTLERLLYGTKYSFT